VTLTHRPMLANRSIPDVPIIPVLGYADLSIAVPWLCDAFGATVRLRIGDHRVQMHLAGGAFVAAQRDVRPGDVDQAHSVMVRVPDARAHCDRARAHGARIVHEPADHAYGECQYAAVDCGGHAWTFTQSIADVDPAAWGGEMVEA